MAKHYSTILSIAGSDSIGGAGIQADIKTASALGVYAMTAITAVTAQNTNGVRAVQVVSPEILKAQLDAISSDVMPDAVKLGMIPNGIAANIIADFLETYKFENLIVDPVMVATSGDSLSEPGTLAVIKNRVLPLATVVTPNIPEAEAITGEIIRTSLQYSAIAEHIISKYGSKGVLVKGGHLPEDNIMTDIFIMQDAGKRVELQFPHPEIITRNTHGTGCTLSSAIASFAAMGKPIPMAVKMGIEFLHTAIDEGSMYEFGSGHGPVNHMFELL